MLKVVTVQKAWTILLRPWLVGSRGWTHLNIIGIFRLRYGCFALDEQQRQLTSARFTWSSYTGIGGLDGKQSWRCLVSNIFVVWHAMDSALSRLGVPVMQSRNAEIGMNGAAVAGRLRSCWTGRNGDCYWQKHYDTTRHLCELLKLSLFCFARKIAFFCLAFHWTAAGVPNAWASLRHQGRLQNWNKFVAWVKTLRLTVRVRYEMNKFSARSLAILLEDLVSRLVGHLGYTR
jgi:hypothetical protein